MSREVIIRIRDDLDGSTADETVAFSYRGTAYEIDLTSHNAELFDKAMQQFLEVARPVEPPVFRAAPRKPTGAPAAPKVSIKVKQQRARIRDWANANGLQVQNRGIIAGAIFEAYLAANPSVTLLPGTRAYGQHQPPVVTSVRAQDGDDGLISAAELLGTQELSKSDAKAARAARDRYTESLGRAKRMQIREWAIENGYEQARTGQLKADVLEAFLAANPEGTE